jgi:hypothetical protein
VVGARDLDGDTLRHTLRDFIQKAAASGPDTVAMIYLAGYGLQMSGENFFVPVDATLVHDTDLPVGALRVSDYIRHQQRDQQQSGEQHGSSRCAERRKQYDRARRRRYRGECLKPAGWANFAAIGRAESHVDSTAGFKGSVRTSNRSNTTNPRWCRGYW